MQTKLSDRGTQLDAETTTSSSNDTKQQQQQLNDENGSFSDPTTPKSKRIKFTFDSNNKKFNSLSVTNTIINKLNNTNSSSHEYDLIDLTNDSPENFECTSVQENKQQIEFNLNKSPINLPQMDDSNKALKELDSNDDSLNRKKSLRTQIRTNQNVQKQTTKQQPQKPNQQQSKNYKFKKYQSVTNIPSDTTNNLTKNKSTNSLNNNYNNNNTTTTTSSTNSNTNNTFACLRNLGSTCYINCIIQVMRYTPGFVNSIHRLNKQIDYLEQSLNADFEVEINTNNNVKFVKNLHQLLEEMSEKEKQDRRPIYSPSKFVKTVWTLLSFWSNGTQQDAHEFLQYTIHFINECDLFIRKIHQQYQLKQMPYLDETSSSFLSSNKPSIVTTTTTTNTTIKSQSQPKTRQTKNSLKSASDLLTSSTLNETKSPIDSVSQPIKIDRRKKEFRNKENLINQNENNLNKLQIVNQNLSDRLIKSIPKIEPSLSPPPMIIASSNQTTSSIKKISTDLESTSTNNFMRTPTKGGASLHVLLNSEDTIQSESDLIEPFKDNITINNNNNKLKLNDKLIDEKDFVSICLKERLSNDYKSSNITNPIARKKYFKRETILNNINQRENINDSINSIILIDSDEEEDQEMTLNEDDYMERDDDKLEEEEKEGITNNENDFKEDDDEQENININKAQFIETKDIIKSNTNESLKEVVISVEKFNLDKLLNNNKLRLSSETINFLEDEIKEEFKSKEQIKMNQSQKKLLQPQELNVSMTLLPVQQQQRQTRNNLKKLTSKAKIFPDFANSTTIDTNNLTDLDEITTLNNICTKPLSNQDSTTNNNKSLIKSKLRTTNTQQTYEPIINANKSPFLLASNLMNKINESSPKLQLNDSKLPPSPAELLRKYSTNNGYTCEMDKLFKGSSITVTQCLECENLRKLPETFYDRSIPLDTTTNQSDCLLNENSNDPNDETVNWISKCLQNESYLNDNSKYMCDKCASKQEAKIHTQYTHMPNILILHLLSYGITSSIDGNLNAQKLSNRSRLVNYFDYICCSNNLENNDNYYYLNSKSANSTPLTTRTSLKRQRSVTTHQLNHNLKHQFKLFAVVMHSGTTLNSGHYTAYVNYKIISQTTMTTMQRFNTTNNNNNNNNSNNKDKSCSCFLNNTLTANLITTTKLNDSEWLHFDDTKVKSLSNLEFHRKIIDSNYDSPYILFYVKE